jgi:hypothetical protein
MAEADDAKDDLNDGVPANDPEPVVTAYMAGSAEEAMVIRGLLESAGISSPGSESADPFPIPENPESPHGLAILVLESQADEAREIIEEYQKSSTAKSADANPDA